MIQYAALESIQPALAKTGPLRITTRRGLELIGECRDCQALVFPLIASKQRLGMVLIHLPKPLPVSDDELQLLRAVVAQVSISLQNALLFQDISHGRDRLTAVLNSVGEGILMLESNGGIMLANEFIQTITGLAREELVNRWLPNLPENALNALGYSRPEAESLVHNLEQNKAVTLPKTTVKTIETKPEMVLERSTSPVWGQGGRIIGWLIVMHDVTEEYQIAQARELITGTLVHDLRSPISSVLSAVDVIEEVMPVEHKDDVIQQALRVAHNGAARMLGLIDTLLDISRMQSGKMDLNLGRVNLHTLAANSLAEFVPQANEYGIIMRNEVPENLPLAIADQSKMTRVITNLLDNAIKFTPAGGQIAICAEPGLDGELVMKISDTGPGIPEEYREKVFDRFTQIPGTHGRRRGSGLGLTFCRMAVEAHGGKIWVESRSSPATGSVFTFTLPAPGPSPTGRND